MKLPHNVDLLIVLNLLITEARQLPYEEATPIVDYLTARRQEVLDAIAANLTPTDDVAIPRT